MFLYRSKWLKKSYSKASIPTKILLSQFIKEILKEEMMEKGETTEKEEVGEEVEEEGGEGEIEEIEGIEGIEEMVKGLKEEIEDREEIGTDPGDKDKRRST